MATEFYVLYIHFGFALDTGNEGFSGFTSKKIEWSVTCLIGKCRSSISGLKKIGWMTHFLLRPGTNDLQLPRWPSGKNTGRTKKEVLSSTKGYGGFLAALFITF